jgi:hypothetical protein
MPGQPGGLRLAIAFHQVLADESDFLRRKLRPEQGRAFALREFLAAGDAAHEADVSSFPGHPNEADISPASFAHVRTPGIDAAKI